MNMIAFEQIFQNKLLSGVHAPGKLPSKHKDSDKKTRRVIHGYRDSDWCIEIQVYLWENIPLRGVRYLYDMFY